MSQIIYPITHLPPVIDIGKQTEKGVTRIGFDVHEWLEDWPGMAFSVQPTRPGETESYLAASEMVGSVVFWLVGAVDTEKPGSGTVEVLGVTEDERKLSFMCRTAIANTNTVTTAEIPEPGRPWLDQVIMAGETAKEKAKEAAESAVSAFQSEQTAGQHSVNAEEKARSAAQSELEATKAMNMAVVQADDAKASANAAEESAKSADDSGRLAQSMSDSSRENANAAREHALSAQQNASEAAKSAAEAAKSVQNFYVVTVTEKNGVQMASSDAMTIWQMAEMGKVCLLVSREHQRAYMYTGYADGAKFDAVAQFHVPDAIPGLWLSSATVADDGTVTFADELPAKTPNPHKLTLTGGEEAEYDGSEAVNVEIPSVFIIKAANSVSGVNQPADKTQAEIRAALNAGKVCLLMNTNSNKVYTYYGFLGGAYVFKVTERSSDDSRLYSYVAEVLKDGTVRFYSNPVTANNPKCLRLRGAVEANYYGGEEVNVDLPTKYPNPNKLTFTGAVKATYDGSSAVTVKIPSGGSGPFTVNATITTMSDDKLTGYATFDKTFAETLAAVKAGRYVTCRVDFGDGVVHIVPACGYMSDLVEFVLAVNGVQLMVRYFEKSEEGPVEITPPAS